MHAAISRLLPAAGKFTRQIVPPVIATLIAAGLISAYNRAFTGHLQQPRMAALHQDAAAPASEPVAKPLAPTDAVAIYDNIAPPARLWEKEAKQESGKDQAIKVAEPAAAAAPVRTAAPPSAKSEPRAEHRRLAIVEPAPVIRAPTPAVAAPVVVAVPPPVVAPPPHAPAVSSMPTVQELRQPVLPPQPHYQQPHYGQPQYQQPPYQQPQYVQPQHPQPQYQQPQYAQPQPPQYQQPPYQPAVITAQPVVMPDRSRPVEPALSETASPPQGPIGKFVDTLKPSNLLARAREFGEKVEQAGNDILPNIRQQ